jgi:membrane protease YdiL (CAAX protease family)
MRWRALLLGVAFEGGMIVLGLPLCWLLGQPPLGEHFSWEPAALARAAGLGLRPLFGESTWLDLGLICVLAGVGEEVLFRAALQSWFTFHLGPWGGLALASLLFGLMHPITRAYIVLAAGLGVYLGLVWLVTGNLLVVAEAHALYDFLVLLVLLRPAKAPGAVG